MLKSEGGIKEHKSKGTKKMMRGRVEPFVVLMVVRVVPTLVHVARQTMKIPQMTIPQETQLTEQRQEVPQMTSPHGRKMREQKQEVKEEHDTRVLKGEEHLHFNANVYEDQMETIASSQHL